MSRTRYVDPSEFVKPKFTYPEVPKAIPVGTCNKCGGSTRAEEFQSWTKLEGLTKKRVFRCIQHGHRCPSVTITVGQEDESMAKPKVIAQTPEWCARMKAACVKKHIRYQDLGVACGLSESTLAQSLNMHSTLSEAAQKAVEQAIEDYTDEPPQSVKARNMAKVRAAKAKPKSETQKAFEPLPASLQASESMGKVAEAMAQETQDTILRNLEAQESLPPGATVTWGEEAFQPSEELVIVDVTGPTMFLEEPTGTGKASDAPDPNEALEAAAIERKTRIKGLDAIPATLDIAAPGMLSQLSVMQFQFQDLEQRHKAVECKIDGVAELYYGLEQRHRALECRVQSLAERAEERFTAFAQGHQLHEDRLGRIELSQVEAAADAEDQDIANAKRFQDLEDRLTSTYDHLTEQIGKLQPWVVPPPPETSNWSFFSVPAENVRWDPDRIVQELSVYTDSQLQALVTAATARRDLLKAMEAA